MKYFTFFFSILIIFSSCKRGREYFIINSIKCQLVQVDTASNKFNLYGITKDKFKANKKLYISLTFKVDYYTLPAEGDSNQYASLEPGLKGSKDSILVLSFDNFSNGIQPNFGVSPFQKNAYVEDSILKEAPIYSFRYKSMEDFVDCYNRRADSCVGVQIETPVIFEILRPENFMQNFRIRVGFTGGRIVADTVNW